MRSKAAHLLLLTIALSSAQSSAAADCSEAAGLNAAGRSQSEWATWCTQCGGEVVAGPSCKPGPRWAGGSSSSTGGSSQLMEKSLEYGTNTGDVGGAALGIGAALLIEGLSGSKPADPGAEKLRLDAERQQAILRAQEKEQKAAEQKARIVPQLKGLSTSVESEPSGQRKNPLGLKLGNTAAPAKQKQPSDRVVDHACEAETDCLKRAACYLDECPKLSADEEPSAWAKRCLEEYRARRNACR